MVARRSTTWPSVPCTVSSASWVRAMSSLRLSTAGVSCVRDPPAPVARIVSKWTSRSARPRSIPSRWPSRESEASSFSTSLTMRSSRCPKASPLPGGSAAARSCRAATSSVIRGAAPPRRRSARARPSCLRARQCGVRARLNASLLPLAVCICSILSCSDFHQRFKPWRRCAAVLRTLGQRICERGNAVFELVERVAAAARGLNLLDLVGEQLHQRFKSRRYRASALRSLGTACSRAEQCAARDC